MPFLLLQAQLIPLLPKILSGRSYSTRYDLQISLFLPCIVPDPEDVLGNDITLRDGIIYTIDTHEYPPLVGERVTA